MNIHNYNYDVDLNEVHIEFSTPKDENDEIRVLDLTYYDVQYYSSDIVDEDTLLYMTDGFILDIIDNYIRERGLPSEIYL